MGSSAPDRSRQSVRSAGTARRAAFMKDLSRLLLIALSLILMALPTKPQSQQAVRNGSDEPFAIGPGTYFSASSPKTAFETKRSKRVAESILDDIEEALQIIGENYVSPAEADAAQISKFSINAMLKTLDPHSNFYDAAEFDELIGEQKSEYFGTGVTIAEFEIGGRLETYVIGTAAGSPASAAGLKFGDKIVALDGKIAAGLDSRQIRGLIRGAEGTFVRITIERDGKLQNFDLRRSKIASPTVTNTFLLNDGVGLIKMDEGFSLTTPAEFDSALRQLKAGGMRSLILDLRGNPGGILESAIKIAEKFLPAGTTIVSQRGRGIWDNRVWQSKNRQPETMPLVLIVNAETASASEVLAGALQDNDRALIIGEKTFGKGLVQTVIGLPGGTGLTLTTARYFTPTGRLIQRDYAHTGNYDYFRHLQTAEVAASVKMRTRRNRIVTSGDGISPDKPVLSEPVTASRLALLDPIFFFSRDIIRGRLAGLSPKTAITGENNGKLADEFAKFAAFWPNGSVLALKNTDWAISQIRYHIILAAEGAAAADRFRLKNDTAVLAAIESMPEARIFAASIFAPKLANAREK